jgi:hypothetical protein
MRLPFVFLLSLLFLSLLIGFNLYSSIHHNGQLVYPLDDAYIHMAISRNLAQHGVWGITRFGFSSTSSSILYTLLLSLFFLVLGTSIWIPFIVNYITAAFILYIFSKISLRFMTGTQALLLNFIFILLVPIPGMVMLGMEHTLQILFCLLFAWTSYRKWSRETVGNAAYYAFALFAVMARYESIFLIGLSALVWLFVFKNWKQFISLGICMALPIFVFGVYALSKGGYFFPNSLLVKSNFVGSTPMAYITELGKKVLANSILFPFVLVPFIYWLVFPVRNIAQLKTAAAHLLLAVTALTATAHLILANYGWLFRYEAYLVALSFLSIAISWPQWRTFLSQRNRFSNALVAVMALILFFPMLVRVQVLSFTNRAMANIGDQQVRIAGFVHQNFPDAGIAINDIGAISFFNDSIHVFDMEGLGTKEVIPVRKHMDSSFLSNYVKTHKINIGIFYPHLYQGMIPSGWQQVGTWELTDNFVTGGSLVGFYAIDSSCREKLLESLKAYGQNLPPNVIQRVREMNTGEGVRNTAQF